MSRKPRIDFGTKTAYPVPHPLQPLPYPPTTPQAPRLIHVSLIARHGTRNPTDSSIARMTSLHQWLHSVHEQPPQFLQDFSQTLATYRRSPGALTSHGYDDLHAIGFRFASLYANALKHVGANLRLRASYKERAVSSARAFRHGYIAACTQLNISPIITTSPLTAIPSRNSPSPFSPSPSPSCASRTVSQQDDSDSDQSSTNPSHHPIVAPGFESDSSQPSTTHSEDTDCSDPDAPSENSSSYDSLPVEVLPLGRDAPLRYFKQNQAYAHFANEHKMLTRTDLSRGSLRSHASEMAHRLAVALGSSDPMDVDLVRAVSEAAAFDMAHGRAEQSLFCAVITPADSKVMDTFEKRHRPFFKGHERFRNVSAPLVEDLVTSLTSSVQRRDDTKASSAIEAFAADLRFAHAETLVPLLLLLGIRSNGLSTKHPDYRLGLAGMSPFAANFAIELYETQGVGGEMEHFVRFRLNERYVERVPALGERGNNGVVQLKDLLEFFNEVLADR